MSTNANKKAVDPAGRTADLLLRQKLQPVLLRPNDKLPLETGWPSKNYKVEDWIKHPGHNVGIKTGHEHGGTLDVDLDYDEAVALAPAFLPPTAAIFGRKSRPRSHRLYKVSAPFPSEFYIDPVTGQRMFELRCDGEPKEDEEDGVHQTMMPGSTHPDGERVEWDNGSATIPVIAPVDGEVMKRTGDKLAAAILVTCYIWKPGYHNEPTKHLAGMIHKAGWPLDEAEAFIQTILDVTGDKDRSRIPTVRDTYRKAEADKPVTGYTRLREQTKEEHRCAIDAIATLIGLNVNMRLLDDMNARYFVTFYSDKSAVISFDERGQLLPMTFKSVHEFYSNVPVPTMDGKFKPLGLWWTQHPQRRKYEGITFQPGAGEVVNGRFNLWRGFGVKSEKGDCKPMLDHIEKIIANGDPVHYQYIIRWLAWSAQNPGKQAEVVLVLKGGKGSGRGILGRTMVRVFSPHGFHASSMDDLVGTYNEHLQQTSFLFADEAYWPGGKKQEGEFKRMITEPTIRIHPKFFKRFEVPNRLHILMVSNEDWVVPATDDERRYAVFQVSEAKRQNLTYFKKLYAHLDDGGCEAFLYYLLNYDLGDWHPRNDIPQTDALHEQKLQSMKSLDAWMAVYFNEGAFPASNGYPPNVARSKDEKDINLQNGILDEARRRYPDLRYKHDQVLTKYLKDAYGCERWHSGEKRGWIFPPLADCRAKFEKRYPGHKWDYDIPEWQGDVVADEREQVDGQRGRERRKRDD